MTALAVLWPSHPGRGEETVRVMMTAAEIDTDRVAFCSTVAELDASGARFVLLAGLEPLKHFRSDLHPGLCHGRAMTVGDRVMFPIFHPESYYRNSRWQTELLKELKAFKRVGRDGVVPATTCVRCRDEVFKVDDCGVAYCFPHWESRAEDPTRRITVDQAAKMF